MNSTYRLFFIVSICSFMTIFFSNEKENLSMTTQELSSESVIENSKASRVVKNSVVTSSDNTFLRNSVSKVRESLRSIKNAFSSNPKHQAPEIKTETHEDLFSLRREPLSPTEIQSIADIAKAMSRAIALNSTSTQFMQQLHDTLKLKPQFLDEGTSSIGSLVTVRTHNSLEGTRYIHAQFTGEKNKADFLQHASFHIRPGPDSFKQAVEALNQVLPKTKRIKEVSNDYALYSTGDGYVAWVKVADLDDLKSNDYNKVSAKDVGTVIVTIEQDIHDLYSAHSH